MWAGRIICQFRVGVSLGPVKGCHVLEAKLQVISPQPCSPASIFVTLVTLCPLRPLNLLARTQRPLLRSGDFCGTFHADVHRVFTFGLWFFCDIPDYSFWVLFSQSAGLTSPPAKSMFPKVLLSPLFFSFLLTFIHFYHLSHQPKL